jgi:hypothetical protein
VEIKREHRHDRRFSVQDSTWGTSDYDTRQLNNTELLNVDQRATLGSRYCFSICYGNNMELQLTKLGEVG